MTWSLIVRLIGKDAHTLEFRVPGGWPTVHVAKQDIPEWLATLPVGQSVICEVEFSDVPHLIQWTPLPIQLEPNAKSIELFEALPEAKLEFFDNTLFGEKATRDAVFAALLSNIGLVEAVRFAPAVLWLKALE